MDFKIIYNDKEYLLEKMIEEENIFSSELKSVKIIPKFSKVFLSIANIQSKNSFIEYIIFQKYEIIIDSISFASFSLSQAFRKLHKYPMEWRSGYKGQLFIRSNYLMNAIFIYQNIRDLILQIIWFDLMRDDLNISNKKDYHKELKKVSVKSLRERMNKNHRFYNLFYNLINDKDISQNNDYANKLKHKGIVIFKGMRMKSDGLIYFNNDLKSSDLDEEEIDVDTYCKKLKYINNLLVQCIDEIWEALDFESNFERRETGYTIKL